MCGWTKAGDHMIETGNEFCFVYSTFPDAESALVVGRTLVERKLAACVNVYPPMTSVYVWRGKQEETQEVAAFIKTRRSLVDSAVAAARAQHPYTTPCFLVLPIAGGNDDYLAWARNQTERSLTV
jgi:periplasmic divalent cation tolerance protein